MRGQTLSTGRRKPAASRPSGRRDTGPGEAGTAPETANPVFQQALEILRREVPPPGQVQSLESKVQSPEGEGERPRGDVPSPRSEVQSPTCEVQGPKAKGQSPEPAGQAPQAPGAATLRAQTLPTLDFRPETLDCAVPPSALATQILPARMLNEFVYCPRLFYYEFVESVFVQSADTLRGKALHRRVDSGKGDLPAAGGGKAEGRRGQKSEDRGQRTEDGLALGAAPSTLNPQPSTDEVIHSRAVQMGSDRLGVTAKMDLIEVRLGSPSGEPDPPADSPPALEGETPDIADSIAHDVHPPQCCYGGRASRITFHASRPLEVCPVDYKAGAPKAGEAGNELWDADRMQLGVQALILRDNGYICNEAVVYYRETKQRVRLPITPELASWVEERIAAARQAAAAPIPPPLVAQMPALLAGQHLPARRNPFAGRPFPSNRRHFGLRPSALGPRPSTLNPQLSTRTRPPLDCGARR